MSWYRTIESHPHTTWNNTNILERRNGRVAPATYEHYGVWSDVTLADFNHSSWCDWVRGSVSANEQSKKRREKNERIFSWRCSREVRIRVCRITWVPISIHSWHASHSFFLFAARSAGFLADERFVYFFAKCLSAILNWWSDTRLGRKNIPTERGGDKQRVEWWRGGSLSFPLAPISAHVKSIM